MVVEVASPIKQATLCYFRRPGQVLLGMKKRGFGEGKWNGYGGKVNPHEELTSAAVREVQEEMCVNISPANLEKIALISSRFSHPKHDVVGMDVHCYSTYRWCGEPQETHEMRPQWFSIKDLPFDQMWESDLYWLLDALGDRRLHSTFYFAPNGETVLRSEFRPL